MAACVFAARGKGVPLAKHGERDLAAAVRDRGFTPGLRDVPALVEMLGGSDEASADGAEKALARLGAEALDRLRAAFAESFPPARARLCRLIGRAGEGAPGTVEFLLAAMHDDDLKTARLAAAALGRVRDPRVEPALLEAWDGAPSAEARRTLAEALGKIGGEASLERLRRAPTDDPALVRVVERARLMLERTLSRDRPGRIRADRRAPEPIPIRFHCREGLEELLAGELGPAWRPRVVGRGRVKAELTGPLASAWVARTALEFSLPLRTEIVAPGEPPADALVRALAGETSWRLLRGWTEGPVRFRLEFVQGGHQRALVWDVAARVCTARPEMQNDPTGSLWEAQVDRVDDQMRVAWVPKGLPDPRFPYRVASVPASSHPTLAAALALIGEARPDDVVWDPFVGAGAELIERYRRGPAVLLAGTDTDERALQAARANLEAAGVPAVLERADSRDYRPSRPPTLIITNPPMGRRVVHHREVGELLDRFLEHAAELLVPGGRLAWIAPQPARTDPRARRLGLACEFDRDIDMGGFRARLQRFRKP